MALPATIDASLSWPAFKNSRPGPFEIGGNLYVVLADTTNATLEVWQSTDGGDTWSELDSANAPSVDTTAAGAAFDAVEFGGDIYAAYVSGAVGKVTKFTVSTSSWGTPTSDSSEPTCTAEHASGTIPILLAVRADGDYVLLHQDDTNKIMGTDYRFALYSIWQSGTWTRDLDLIGSTEYHQDVRAIVKGDDTNDRVHFFYSLTDATSTVRSKTLTSANSLSSATSLLAGAPVTDNHAVGLPVSFVDGTATQVVVPLKDSIDDLIVQQAEDADSLTWGTADTVSTTSPESTNANPAALATDGATHYVLWPNDADQDLYRRKADGFGNYSTEVEHADAVTINGISAHIIGDLLGMVYDDGGTVKFDSYRVRYTGFVQRQSNYGDPPSATYDSTPTEGNLLIAFATGRSGQTSLTMDSSGWTKIFDHPANSGDSTYRRILSSWYKTAGASESTTVALTNTGGNCLLTIEEYEITDATYDTWTLEDSASADDDTTTNGGPLNSGDTDSITADAQHLVGMAMAKNSGGTIANGGHTPLQDDGEDQAGGGTGLSNFYAWAGDDISGAKSATIDADGGGDSYVGQISSIAVFSLSTDAGEEPTMVSRRMLVGVGL